MKFIFDVPFKEDDFIPSRKSEYNGRKHGRKHDRKYYIYSSINECINKLNDILKGHEHDIILKLKTFNCFLKPIRNK